jgi:hypothetical protein
MLLHCAQMAAIPNSEGSFRALSALLLKTLGNGSVTFGSGSASAQGGGVRP